MKYRMKSGKLVDVYTEMPDGWRELKGSLTQPNWAVWIGKGSLFAGDYQQALLIISPENVNKDRLV